MKGYGVSMISSTLKEIASKYLDEKNTPIANNKFASFVREAAKEKIKPKVKKNRDHFFIKVVQEDLLIGQMYLGLVFMIQTSLLQRSMAII